MEFEAGLFLSSWQSLLEQTETRSKAIAKTSRQRIAEAVDVPARCFLDLRSVSTIEFGCQHSALLLIQKYYGRIRAPFIRGVLVAARKIEPSGTIILVLLENRVQQRHSLIPLACT